MPRVAGLVAWAGDNDHIGVIRCEALGKGIIPLREAFQVILIQPKQVTTANGFPTEQSADGFVRLRREGKNLFCAYGRDGKQWTEFLPDKVEWNDTLKVGVYAKHFTNTPFEVTFDQYTLTLPKK
jgi:hypothetical protein